MQTYRRYLLIVAFVLFFIVVIYFRITSKVVEETPPESLVHASNDREVLNWATVRDCDPGVSKLSPEKIFQRYWNNSNLSSESPPLPSHDFLSLGLAKNPQHIQQRSSSLVKFIQSRKDFDRYPSAENETFPNFIDNSTLLAMHQDMGKKDPIGPFENIFDFSSCRMSTCFDFKRCNLNNGLRVHLVPPIRQLNDHRSSSTLSNLFNVTSPNSLIYTAILEIIRRSNYYEPDPNKACLFIPESHTLDRDPLSSSFQDNLNNMIGKNSDYGLNYLIFNLFSGSWPDYYENDYSGMQIGAAILAKASISHLQYRPGFDISLPLFNISHPLASLSTSDMKRQPNLASPRKYLISFKGKRYTVGNGSETRNSLFHLHNDRDVIMLTTCRHGKRWRQMKDRRCDEDNRNYDNYDYQQLMKDSSFCLIPRGRRLGSYRFLEALYNDCIPVVLSNGWILPFNTMVDWTKCVVQIDERLVLQVPDLLRGIHPKTIETMRRECINIYNRYFSSMEEIVMSTFGLIEKRLKFDSRNL